MKKDKEGIPAAGLVVPYSVLVQKRSFLVAWLDLKHPCQFDVLGLKVPFLVAGTGLLRRNIIFLLP